MSDTDKSFYLTLALVVGIFVLAALGKLDQLPGAIASLAAALPVAGLAHGAGVAKSGAVVTSSSSSPPSGGAS